MHKVLRWVIRGLLGGIAILVVLLVGALAYSGLSQRMTLASTRIDTERGIESLEKVVLGGLEQTIYLRGHDQKNPLLLFLHGGPGLPSMPQAREFGLRLEEHFVVVHWDQRGAGSSCDQKIPNESLNREQYLADTLELVNLLRHRFRVEKIHLLGHSWGSVLGAITAQRHPELLHTYIGMGQVVNIDRGEQISYRFVVEAAKAEGNQNALRELETIQPPYANTKEVMIQRSWLGYYRGDSLSGDAIERSARAVFLSPEYDISTKLSFYGCAINSLDHTWDNLQDIDFFLDIPRLDVPVYFFMGRHDYNTPFSLVERYFEILEAPYKEIVWFEESAHMPNLEEPERFQDAIIEKISTQPSAASL
ncbi:MAG: alpha/beta hydrolase [Myxococcota bacterium]